MPALWRQNEETACAFEESRHGSTQWCKGPGSVPLNPESVSVCKTLSSSQLGEQALSRSLLERQQSPLKGQQHSLLIQRWNNTTELWQAPGELICVAESNGSEQPAGQDRESYPSVKTPRQWPQWNYVHCLWNYNAMLEDVSIMTHSDGWATLTLLLRSVDEATDVHEFAEVHPSDSTTDLVHQTVKRQCNPGKKELLFCWTFGGCLPYSIHFLSPHRKWSFAGKQVPPPWVDRLRITLNEWMNEWCIYIALLLCIAIHPKRFTIMWGVTPQPPPVKPSKGS